MTRYLSLALGAQEPLFSHSIRQLEQASGAPSADIRLTTDIQIKTRQKIAELGLDPNDTTGPELYSALHERMRIDDEHVRAVLSLADSANSLDVLTRVEEVIAAAEMPKQCFALKASVAKRLFKKKAPKNVMKRLGYRSLDSMLKHEPVAAIYAAAVIAESDTWRRHFYEQYDNLRPSDFEMRPMHSIMPRTKKWDELAASYVTDQKHNLLTFKELGITVMLPMVAQVDGLAITSLLLSLNAMNDIRSYSSFIKLQQVKPDFGAIVRQAAVSEPQVSAELAGQPVTWRTIHRYFAKYQEMSHPEVFEPHVQPEDLTWAQAEDVLVQLAPTLKFWQDTQSIALLHDGQPVSCNMLDVALSYYNQLPFADRIVHFFRDNVWHELMTKYLNQRNLEAAVGQQLSYELVDDLSLAE